ncbi:hypothetical protein [Micromonospora sp. NPDC023956]|uniref:hypothetical protein n=1 Tax=Micromonospora sp. NPDC023956 TaxID=3155722 RepID=UPI0033CB4840
MKTIAAGIVASLLLLVYVAGLALVVMLTAAVVQEEWLRNLPELGYSGAFSIALVLFALRVMLAFPWTRGDE